MTSPFRLEPLSAYHNRSLFSCGEAALDRYFQAQATQDAKRHIANCFVSTETANGVVAGYYTIAATGIPILALPSEVAGRLPRYPSIPGVRIGRLAVDRNYQRRGLGGALLADAARRTMDAGPAAYALIVDAKNDQASLFYQHHGFMPFAIRPHTLFLPIAVAAKLFAGSR